MESSKSSNKPMIQTKHMTLAASIAVLSVPFSILCLGLFAQNESIICGISLTEFEFIKWFLLLVVGSLIVLSILSFEIKGLKTATCFATAVFFMVIGVAHLFRIINSELELKFLGISMPHELSSFVALLVFPLFALNLHQAFVKEESEGFFELYGKFRDKVKDLSPYSATIAGIALAGLVSIPCFSVALAAALYLTYNLEPGLLFNQHDIVQLAWIGIVGAQGSVVSMFIRIRHLSDRFNKKPYPLFVDAFIRPFIGLSFAHLSYFLLKIDIIFPYVQDQKNFFYYAVSLAFMVGFTERVSKDLLKTD